MDVGDSRGSELTARASSKVAMESIADNDGPEWKESGSVNRRRADSQDELHDQNNGNAEKYKTKEKNSLFGIASERENALRNRILSISMRRQGHETVTSALDTLSNQLSALELAFDAIDDLTRDEDNRKSDSQSDGDQIVERFPAIPESKLLSWKVWTENMGKPTPNHHYAIDLLKDEPVFSGRSIRPSTRRNRTLNLLDNGANFTQLSSLAQHERPGVESLPERIRINSVAAKRILDAICDNVLCFSSKDRPLILLRPFYLLVHVEQDIRDRMSELEQDLVEKEAMLPDKPQEGKINITLRSDSRFPRGLIFYLGTDWSTLTINECREAVIDFHCLVSFMDDYINPLQNYFKNPEFVQFQELWHLYPLGSLIFVKEKSIPQKIWKVTQACGGRKTNLLDLEDKYSPFILNCYYLDYDGSKFVRVFQKFEIVRFTEWQLVSSLPWVPFSVAEREHMINRQSSISRGEQFLACTKPSYLYYEGRSLNRTPVGTALYKPSSSDVGLARVHSEYIESQVMVDFDRALQAMPDWSPAGSEMDRITMDSKEFERYKYYEQVDDDKVWVDQIEKEFLDEEERRWQKWDKNYELPFGDDLLLFPDRVFAFIFRTRSWVCLQLGHDSEGQNRLRPVKQKTDAWDDLEIPDGHKSIVQSLIESHFAKHETKRMDFDLVRDKGKGIIVLLHGAPGVGKTSTAECVAESNNKPLLPITCGDLGLTAKDVESKLQVSFELAQAWDCVLLLDEADVFLAQRTPENIERNALVSVFLRVLEYYEGILFLTTNRVGSFDEAFKSRIHMALYYPPLNWEQTEKIWRSQIRRTLQLPRKVECDETILLRYADELFREQTAENSVTGPAWNGRQIRNAFQSAVALAKYGTEPSETIVLKRSNFEKVATASNEFNNYLLRVKNQQTDADWAKSKRLRDDAFNANSTTAIPVSNSYRYDFPQRPAFRSQIPAVRQDYLVPQPQSQPQLYASVQQMPYQLNAQIPGHPVAHQNFTTQPQMAGNSQPLQQMYYPQGAVPQQQQTPYNAQQPQQGFSLQQQPQQDQIQQNGQLQSLGQPDATNQRISASQQQSNQQQMQPPTQGQQAIYYRQS